MDHSLLNLRSQLRFYKYYHYNTTNVLIHSVFVPTILFSSLSILHGVPLPGGWSLSHLVSLLFSAFYILLYLPSGLVAAAILALFNASIDNRWVDLSGGRDWVLFSLGWIMQFIGHGAFEKKRPAVLDNLVQSLVTAPYFILFELFFLLGFMPTLKRQLDADVKEMRTARGESR
ncbi:2-hydroxy-palmitic acid dioxygenase MPO1 KNAG_0D03550 [Huiozyma naganishii CBS 8797]|uniref:DUF962 domain protein n=1 Tax=Huiozyma naganishii (strain ATCC MYA-139 / BCRC 22969 / CBS 8797 / KCTC 17520 / NBRC 10181 / NCYC 3082 / Yp74L-3) TaxID=1071383 RepID=J7S745_HUIN7|nr:hypothetical protein KNAG_0D03550 [Kazachstania naganishii CBS 8797]CCK70101.1 hypothetical protein KNAG_0D03550 [Kazachstania naganishii CBS 8797]